MTLLEQLRGLIEAVQAGGAPLVLVCVAVDAPVTVNTAVGAMGGDGNIAKDAAGLVKAAAGALPGKMVVLEEYRAPKTSRRRRKK